jgi:peptidoglycan hydrolase-like protein with peptidoglycan-binding domain
MVTIASFPGIYFNNAVTQEEMISSSATSQTELNPVIVWNNLTTSIALKEKLSPPELSRAYALLHVSIYDSLLAANQSYQGTSNIETIAGAASTILSYLFPDYIDEINKVKEVYISEISIAHVEGAYNEIQRIRERTDYGEIIGREIAKFADYQIGYSNTTRGLDGSVKNTVLTGPCIWNGSNPILPTAGHWKTYILTSGLEFQPPPPGPCQSEEDLKNVQEVVDASNNRTSYQITAIHYWGDKLPPSIWNNILNEEIKNRNLSLFDAARASVYLNVAIYDACISTWYTKYTYWTARPVERIDNFTTVIPTPNFPGYTSGHSTMSVAASEVLSELFPDERENFHNKANEAKMSRLWAGIHFTQDNERGADIGMQIGKKIVEDMQAPLHTFVYSVN